MNSTVLILPIAEVPTGNIVGEAMGWGPNNYSVPLSVDGAEPATHYGLHAWTTTGFRHLIEGGNYPAALVGVGVGRVEYRAMRDALIYSFRSDLTDHFATVCAENNLTRVGVDDAAR